MANGDAAAAAGINTVPQTRDVRLGYDDMNRILDLLVQRVFPGSQISDLAITTAKLADGAVTPAKFSGVLTLAKGGTGADTVSGAQQAIMGGQGVFPARQEPGSGTTIGFYTTAGAGQLWFRGDPGSTGLDKRIMFAGEVSSTATSSGNQDFTTGTGRLISPGSRAATVSGWAPLAIDPNGVLGIGASARRFKKNIRDWADDEKLDAYLALPDRTYQLRASIEGAPDGPVQLGHIAEELQPIFPEMVPLDQDPDSPDFGLPITINYAQLVVPLHALAKRQQREIEANHAEIAELRSIVEELAAKVEKLEAGS